MKDYIRNVDFLFGKYPLKNPNETHLLKTLYFRRGVLQQLEKEHKFILDWYRSMASSTAYLPMDVLRAGMAYQIWARNAHVGIWLPAEQGFLISRYKMGAIPRLSIEQHWDVGEPLGTAKPLHTLEDCPMVLPACFQTLVDREAQAICAWLDALETQYPLFPGVATVASRREAAIAWQQRQRAERRKPLSLLPIHLCESGKQRDIEPMYPFSKDE